MTAMLMVVVLSNGAFGAPDREAEQGEAAERAMRRFHVGVPGATTAHTTSNGITLGLEFARTSIVAGERLTGTMIVSNASTVLALFQETGGETDTGIGHFEVKDEGGNILPRTVPRYYRIAEMGGKGIYLNPGESTAFNGDVVWCYSLTTPGNYVVRARAYVPLTNDAGRFTTFAAQTPPIAITVLPRPDGRPPPGNIYTNGLNAEQLEIFNEMEARNTRRARTSVPRVAPREVVAAPLPVKVRDGVTAATAGAAADQSTPRPRNYGVPLLVIVTGLLALGAILWRARRRQHP